MFKVIVHYACKCDKGDARSCVIGPNKESKAQEAHIGQYGLSSARPTNLRRFCGGKARIGEKWKHFHFSPEMFV